MKADRPLLDKFVYSVFFDNVKDLGRSIAHEINNILSSRVPKALDLPFKYGILDFSVFNEDESLFISYIKKAILEFEPRINLINITDLKVDRQKQVISFTLKFTLKSHYIDSFVTNIYVRI